MKKYSTRTVQYHEQFQGSQNNKNHAFPSKRCTNNKKVLLLHILQRKSYVRACT